MSKQPSHSDRHDDIRVRRPAGGAPRPSSQLSRGAARRRAASQPCWKANAPILITVATVAALIGIFVLLSRQGGSTARGVGDPVPPEVLQAVTNPDPSIFAK